MTPPDDIVRIRHLQEAAQKAIDFSQCRTRQSFDDDELLRLALTKLIEIVGEAAKQVTEVSRHIAIAANYGPVQSMNSKARFAISRYHVLVLIAAWILALFGRKWTVGIVVLSVAAVLGGFVLFIWSASVVLGEGSPKGHPAGVMVIARTSNQGMSTQKSR